MKNKLLIFWILLSQLVNATRPMPLPPATSFSSLFSNKDIEILSQKVHLKIDGSFSNTHYIIEYNIKSKQDLTNQHFLFVNKYTNKLNVMVDGKTMEIKKDIPENYEDFEESKFVTNFSDYIIQNSRGYIKLDNNNSQIYNTFSLQSLSFFNTSISKGIHKIKIEFNATPFENRDELRKARFIYWLASKKKQNTSFELTIEQEKDITYTVNLESNEINALSKTWKFDNIPSDYITIQLVPRPSLFAKFLLMLTPFGLSLIITAFFIWMHYKSIKSYRIQHPKHKYSTAVIFGSIIMPFLGYLAFLFSDSFIKTSLGIYKGYTDNLYLFLIIFVVYPIILPIYWVLAWLVDKKLK